mmetsp:Transcript_3433/g.2892  ORF Transcript_3433/g.2892 Transcript_3433/m.2892 type:complete len:153 (+) Transcript_3433:315-773(+)
MTKEEDGTSQLSIFSKLNPIMPLPINLNFPSNVRLFLDFSECLNFVIRNKIDFKIFEQFSCFSLKTNTNGLMVCFRSLKQQDIQTILSLISKDDKFPHWQRGVYLNNNKILKFEPQIKFEGLMTDIDEVLKIDTRSYNPDYYQICQIGFLLV